MKKTLSLSIILLVLFSSLLSFVPASAADEWSGWTPISSSEDFSKISSGSSADVPNKYYLTTDISTNSTIGQSWNSTPIQNVIIDGNDKTITLSKSLFNRVDNFTMQNIKLAGKISWTSEPFQKSPIASGNGSASGKVTLSNVTSDVDMEMCFSHRYKRFAGVIYYTDTGSVLTNVSYTGNIIVKNSTSFESKVESLGGIVGTANGTTFTSCINEGDIVIEEGVSAGRTDGGATICGNIGGITGNAVECTFKGCENRGDITVNAASGIFASSGIAGTIGGSATLSLCKNSGNITTSSCTNGLLSCLAYNTTLEDCENLGNISINYSKIEGTDASCVQQGVTEHYFCGVCSTRFDESGKQLEPDDIFLNFKHNLGELVAEKKATCLENGMNAHYFCSDCHDYFDANGEKTTKFALTRVAGHIYTKVEASSKTESSPEVKEHYFCSICSTYFDLDKKRVEKSQVILDELAAESSTDTAADTSADETDANSGCASSISCTAVLIVALGAIATLKKKDS